MAWDDERLPVGTGVMVHDARERGRESGPLLLSRAAAWRDGGQACMAARPLLSDHRTSDLEEADAPGRVDHSPPLVYHCAIHLPAQWCCGQGGSYNLSYGFACTRPCDERRDEGCAFHPWL